MQPSITFLAYDIQTEYLKSSSTCLLLIFRTHKLRIFALNHRHIRYKAQLDILDIGITDCALAIAH